MIQRPIRPPILRPIRAPILRAAGAGGGDMLTQLTVGTPLNVYNWQGYPRSAAGGRSAATKDPVLRVKGQGVSTDDFWVDNGVLKDTVNDVDIDTLYAAAINRFIYIFYDHENNNDIDISAAGDATKPHIDSGSWPAGTRNIATFNGINEHVPTAYTPAVIPVSDHMVVMLARLTATPAANKNILSTAGSPNWVNIYNDFTMNWGCAAGSSAATGGSTDTNAHTLIHYQSNTAGDDGLYNDSTASREVIVTTANVGTVDYTVGSSGGASYAAVELAGWIIYDAATSVADAGSIMDWGSVNYTSA